MTSALMGDAPGGRFSGGGGARGQAKTRPRRPARPRRARSAKTLPVAAPRASRPALAGAVNFPPAYPTS
jgi:hypothetical protein